MRVRAGCHGINRRGAAKSLAVLVAAAALLAQFSSAWHEVAVQHVRCAEHGELTHLTARRGAAPTPARQLGAADAAPAETPDGHEHCAALFTIQGGAHAPVVRTPVAFAPPPVVAARAG